MTRDYQLNSLTPQERANFPHVHPYSCPCFYLQPHKSPLLALTGLRIFSTDLTFQTVCGLERPQAPLNSYLLGLNKTDEMFLLLGLKKEVLASYICKIKTPI